jgi:hypothetical protein
MTARTELKRRCAKVFMSSAILCIISRQQDYDSGSGVTIMQANYFEWPDALVVVLVCSAIRIRARCLLGAMQYYVTPKVGRVCLRSYRLRSLDHKLTRSNGTGIWKKYMQRPKQTLLSQIEAEHRA